ncbi:hypothetical protein RIVERRIDER_69 [Xanthomonas phage RiverRider]|uniref:Uncharacterized protein n=1 Tax=Xanthomonas phage RiverRider TaxID=2108116 RepID=A0A2P1JUV8_9CAUD|nr:hypothetical protein HWB58_gp66 [Xanthomonas phage RiverRider]AVO23150.1 hypothetical protein RIVERRIDER_69 [Xanthomonas phage RiverRider]
MALEITIDQNEIETAIRNHIGTLITVAEGQNIGITLKAGRGENGYSATIEIGGQNASQVEGLPKQPAAPSVSGPFKRGAKPAQADTSAPVGETPISELDQTQKETALADTQAPSSTGGEVEAQSPQDTAEAEAPAEQTKPKGGLFQHLPKRTGTDAEAK